MPSQKSFPVISRFFTALLLVTLFFTASLVPASSGKTTTKPTNRLQPLLISFAEEKPNELIRVIVQKATRGREIEALIQQLGGTILNDLSIINAVVIQIPAKSVLALGESSAVRWASFDAPVQQTAAAKPPPAGTPTNTYLDTLNVRNVWNAGFRGQNIGVVVIDSGISTDPDFSNRLVKQLLFNASTRRTNDVYGHGTHVAGIIAGNGADSANYFSGIAPQAKLISLKISNEQGMATESDTVAALQWVYNNKTAHKIRVVNMSLNSTVEQSFHYSPINAAIEILWFNGIVVVTSAGNNAGTNGPNTINAAPANDPFAITVGASDEKGTITRGDDSIASFSAYGFTRDGSVRKPDLIAPGTNIISVLSKDSSWATAYPNRVIYNNQYFRLSGTSMAAPMVSGVIALMLQKQPNLTPDQVKYRLTHTGSTLTVISGNTRFNFPYLDAYLATISTTLQSSNTGNPASQLLWTGSSPVNWNSVNWNSVNWNSVNWNSVNWNSVNWNSVNWNSTYWGN